MKTAYTYYLKTLFMALLCMAAGVYAMAETPQDIYKSAGELYKNKQYDKAAAAYEKIVSSGYKNASVYYNLGNCYYKLNNTGKAILYYERAKQLAPDDEEINHNLKIANFKVADKLQPVPQLGIITWWSSFTNRYTSGGWGLFAVVFLWLALMGIAIYLFIYSGKIASYAVGLFVLLSLSFMLLAFKQSNIEQNGAEAVLLSAQVDAKSAPDAGSTNMFVIHQGIKFQLMDRVGVWYKIRLSDGKTGWVERNTFEKI